MEIERSFVRIAEGQVHVRTCGEDKAAAPLYMIHASPASALTMVGLIESLAATRRVIAPDTLGNGDSCTPANDRLPLLYFADAHLRVLGALGIERFDVCGVHASASIACEMAAWFKK